MIGTQPPYLSGRGVRQPGFKMLTLVGRILITQLGSLPEPKPVITHVSDVKAMHGKMLRGTGIPHPEGSIIKSRSTEAVASTSQSARPFTFTAKPFAEVDHGF